MIIIGLKVPCWAFRPCFIYSSNNSACQEQAKNPPVENKLDWLIPAADLRT